jgi:ABC-type transport system involved in cytochrome bd biosynthesis fused ATPase/permease subunit
LGVTGEGKSTLVSAFGGFKLNARMDDETMSIIIEHAD